MAELTATGDNPALAGLRHIAHNHGMCLGEIAHHKNLNDIQGTGGA